MNPDICSSALEEDGTLDRSNGPEWGKHKFDEDGVCDECGLTKEDSISACPSCNTEQKSNDIEYLGDQKYQCPNCK